MHGMVETRMGDIISLFFVFWFFFFFCKWEEILENHDDNNNNWNLLSSYCAFSFWRHWVLTLILITNFLDCYYSHFMLFLHIKK